MAEYIERGKFLEEERKQYCADCDRRKGIKRGKMQIVYAVGDAPCRACGIDDVLTDVEDFPAALVVPTEKQEIETALYDEETVYDDCTVIVWRNSVTGEESIGWFQNGGPGP